MTPPFATVLVTALGFLAGSIPWALLIGRWMGGVDIRSRGSGNLGATNVFRVLGPRAGILVLALDMGKGALAVSVARAALGGSEACAVAAALAAIAGHIASPWVRFHGGKGVATAAGCFLALAPAGAGAALLVWAALLGATRYVSVASMGASVALPLLLRARAEHALPGPVEWLAWVVCLVVVLRHVPNLKRLVAGKESRFRFRRGGQEMR